MVKLMMSLILMVMFAFPNVSEARRLLTERQVTLTQAAYDAGQKIQWNGDTFGKTFAGIIWQESRAGEYRRMKVTVNGITVEGVVGDRKKKPNGLLDLFKCSLGPSQMQPGTALWLRDKGEVTDLYLEKFGTLYPTTNEVIVALLEDEVWNIKMGARYFDWLLDYTGRWNLAILGYNRGQGNAMKVWKGIKTFRQVDVNRYVPYVKKRMKGPVRDFLSGNYKQI